MSIKKVFDNGTHRAFEPAPTLAAAQAARIAEINEEAKLRIEALDWMHERSDRHTALNKSQKKAKNEVYQLQQDIEEASDQAVIDIMALTTIEEVQSFVW